MGMVEHEERMKLRQDTRDFLINAGSPITATQLKEDLGTSIHTAKVLLDEFNENKLAKSEVFKPYPNIKPVELWRPTPKLKEMDKKDFEELIKIEKPKRAK
jgi:hypothetical protein